MATSNIPINIPAPFVPVPSDDVHFTVEVDRTRCSNTSTEIERQLQTLETSGLQMSIAEIVVRAGLHFAGAVVNRGEGFEIAQIRHAWSFLMDWNLQAVAHLRNPARTVLVVDDQKNSRLSATRSEILAFGIGLEAASQIYQINYQLWEGSAGLSKHDVQTWGPRGGLIKVELRGRTNRKNLGSAVRQIHNKFSRASFSNAAGIIVFPHTTNASMTADIMIVDPPGDRPHEIPVTRLRVLLRHYAPFFYFQGGFVRRFGQRMQDLSDSNDDEFLAYLNNGDDVLNSISVKPARVGFTWDGIRYIGTIWEGVYWPKWLVSLSVPSSGGVFFWGLQEDIVSAIRNGHLKDVAEIKNTKHVIRETHRFVVVMTDGTALIWAPTSEELDIQK